MHWNRLFSEEEAKIKAMGGLRMINEKAARTLAKSKKKRLIKGRAISGVGTRRDFTLLVHKGFNPSGRENGGRKATVFFGFFRAAKVLGKNVIL